MNPKDKYIDALKNNKGKFDEITLGKTIGLDENSTRKIISELLSEFRIEFEEYGLCNYRIRK
jgi:hypothetical protein